MATSVGLSGGWLCTDPKDRRKWLSELCDEVDMSRSDDTLHPVIQELKALIEDRAELSMLFREMFNEIPFSLRYDPVGNQYTVCTVLQLVKMERN